MFRTTIESFSDLTASRHKIRLHCSAESAKDPDREWCGDGLEQLCKLHGVELQWREAQPSLGGNMNSAIDLCSADAIVLIQDDCPLIRPLDLSPSAELIAADPGVSMIRYEWPPPPRCTLVPYRDEWRRFELVNRLYGDRAFMIPQGFFERHGRYARGGQHGNSEVAMLNRLRSDQAVILATPNLHFEHINGVPAVIRDHRSNVPKR
jgi:hypothetical protein